MVTTASILGYPVSTLSLAASLDEAWRLMGTGRFGYYMACANAHSLITAGENDTFAQALREADLLVPDGAGILIAGRILGRPFPERVAGMEFFTAMSRRAEAQGGLSYYFLGSSETVLARILERMAEDYPHIRVAGTYSPPFKAHFDGADNDAMIDLVNAAEPDVLWVGMTAPKQEVWIHGQRHRLRARFIGAVGAVFDFYAGTKKRPPEWMCNNGLEWVGRLVQEPDRLWRRTVVSSPRFFLKVIGTRLAGAD
jgi:N-acetylglucosaminyldiphosphoundecaprenol N-acetyl-beta-D-mannosaminyltransferase